MSERLLQIHEETSRLIDETARISRRNLWLETGLTAAVTLALLVLIKHLI